MKGRKAKMPKKVQVLTDRNHNEFSNQNIHSEVSPASRVFHEIDMMTLNENQQDTYDSEASGLEVCKEKTQICQAENEKLYRSPIENKSFRSTDEYVLFRRRKSSQPPGLNYFSYLSDEIILHIFKLLPKSVLVKCSVVCKRWQYLSYDETLWKRYDMGRKVVKPGTLEVLLKRKISILRLAMSEIRYPVFSKAFINFPWRGNLQYLDLSMAMIKPQDLADLLSKCCSLRKLSIEHCTLNEECCTNIAENSHLEVLNMAMCEGVTAAGLLLICVCCKNLKEWNLGWCKLAKGCVDQCFHLFPSTLRRLNLSGQKELLNDAALIKVAKRCRGLRELDISDNVQITHASMEVVIKHCLNLQHLHTSRSYNIPTETNKLLRNLKNFRSLEIFQTLTDAALASLRDYMPEVKINQHTFSTIARPTVGIRRTSIWEIKTRESCQ